jgi:mono/diheme cytochrome c family protein
MDIQPKHKAYGVNNWFSNKMNMRPLVTGVIARGYLKIDDLYYKGMLNEKFSNIYPKQITLNRSFIKRGQNRFNIFCAVCHDAVGGGNGLAGRNMLIKPMLLHGDYMYNLAIGRLFDIISNGSRTMPSHRLQISEKDRWAIVSYIKALQISQNINGDW